MKTIPTSIRILIPTILAASISACGSDNHHNSTPSVNDQIPTLSFTDSKNSYELNNYTQIKMIPLKVGKTKTDGNLLNDEASGVTYNKDTDTLFVAGDGATAVVQVSKEDGHVIDSMTLADGEFEDIEGLTYVGHGKFAIIEERQRQINLFTYVPGGTLHRSDVQAVKLGTTVGNVGIEGISFDPKTGGYIAVRQSQPTSIFQAMIDFEKGTATDSTGASILPSTENPNFLFPAEKTELSSFNDVAALSNVSATNDNLLLISAPDGKIVEMDRAGKLLGHLYMSATAQNEGITIDTDGTIYAVGEQAAGPSLPGLTIFKPTTDKTNVGIGSNLYLTFDQAMQAGTGNIVLSNGQDTRTIPVSDASQVSFSGNVVKIHPKFYMAPNTTYSITYDAGALKTAAGANAIAVSDQSTFSFKTIGQEDKTAPTLTSTAPVNGATGIIGNHFTLNFDEVVQAGEGDIIISNGTDTQKISITDTDQVHFNGGRISIDLSKLSLKANSKYTVKLDKGVVTDLYGNAFAGLEQNFSTAAAGAPAPTVLISEVNSNADGDQDFFELYNYGNEDIDLTGWKWGDSHADVNDANNSAAFTKGTILKAGEHLVVISGGVGVPATDVATFRTNWNLDTSVPVVEMLNVNNDPNNLIGLGKADAVIVYDANGNVAAFMNYGVALQATQGDGTLAPIPTALGADADLVAEENHSGAIFANGSKTKSAVWDTVSDPKQPKYIAAMVGELNGFAEPKNPKSIGSPGL